MDNQRPGTSTSFLNKSNNESIQNMTEAEISEIYNDSILQMLDEPYDLLIDRTKLRTDTEYYGFDNNTGDTWIYPKNYPIRHYQYNITKVALFQNTLVALPTGLGKTFIAAVVMYNFLRWYPLSKIIFMAPTRPLVSQQIEACYKIMGISKSETVELTGKQTRKIRKILWDTKRVFFATPQTVQSDIGSDEDFPFKSIRLIVVDEAHKAKGKYAYTEVIQAIVNRNRHFRVLALSATPGRHIDDVVQVIQNLLISHVEIRWENSIDVSAYVHKKNIKTEVVSLGNDLKEIRSDFVLIMDKYVRNLLEADVLHGNTATLNKNSLLIQQKRFREMSNFHHHPNRSNIMSEFSTAISLYHALELLEKHGIRIFLNFFDNEETSTNEKYFVTKDRELKLFIANLHKHIGPNPFLVNDETLPNGTIPEIPVDLDFGHPKFRILQNYLIEHFTKNPDSRAIVFCEFRESVLLVHRLLLQNRPLIRPKFIVGKGSSIGIKAVTEKQQKNVMKNFREGCFNTLIATCVAEEGIDVGEVDMIICFDINTRNPTRFVQRMGRTGRQRQGRVIMLVTEGYEHDTLKDVLSNKDKTNQKIVRSTEVMKNLYKNQPKLIPPEFSPQCLEVFIKINNDDDENNSNIIDVDDYDKETEKKKKKPKGNLKNKNNKKLVKLKGMKDVREFFKKTDLEPNDIDVFATPQIPHVEAISNPISPAVLPSSEPNRNSSIRVKNLIKDQKQLLKQTRSEIKPKTNFKIANLLNSNIEMNFDLKKIILQLNPDFIETKLEAATVLDAIENNTNDDDDDDVIILEPEYNRLKSDIDKINKLFNGSENLKLYLNYFNKNIKRYFEDIRRIHISERKLNFNMNSKMDNEKLVKLKNSLNKLKLELFSNRITENLDYIDSSTSYFHKMNNTENDTMDNTSVITNKLCYSTNYENSPLLLAFNKSVKKKTASSPHHRRKLNPSINEFLTLEYFGLKTFDEIFVDEESDMFHMIQPKKLLFTEHENNEIISLSPIHQPEPPPPLPSQFSISQALNIVEKPTATKKDNFDLGEIDEIFCSDDDDLFADCDDENLTVNKNTNINKEDNMTQDYDYIVNYDYDKLEKSSDIFETTAASYLSGKHSSESKTSNNNKKNNLYNELQMIPEENLDTDIFDLLTIPNPNLNNKSAEKSNDAIFDIPVVPKINVSVDSENTNFFEALTIPNPYLQRGIKKTPESVSFNYDAPTQKFHPVSQSVLSNRKLNLNKLMNNSNYSKNHSPKSSVLDKTKSPFFQQTQFSQIPVPSIRNRKRFISTSDSSIGSISDEENKNLNIIQEKNNNSPKKRKRLKRCEFIDDEVEVCNNDSSDDEECTDTQKYLADSIMAHSDVEDVDIDMHAMYLKSINSPSVRRNGQFRIPIKKKYSNLENIFSQMPIYDPAEDTYCEKNNSFVDDDLCSPIKISDDECPLEKAEKILKERRKLNRLVKKGSIEEKDIGTNKRKKRRRITFNDSSDDDDSSDESVQIV